MSIEDCIFWIVAVCGGYILGSCMFSQWLPQMFQGRNIMTESDDGCPGSFNVFKICGWRLGFLCLSLDMMKGFLPVYSGIIAGKTQNPLFILLMIAPVAGHAWPIFNKFNGGKCIATIFGELLSLCLISLVGLVLAVLFIVFSTVVKITTSSKRSMIVFFLFGCISFVIELLSARIAIGIGCITVSAIAILKQIPSYKIKH